MAVNEIECELSDYVEAAAEAGCPQDQIERFIRFGYVAYPWALAFHAAARQADHQRGPIRIACGGARGPGKSHAILAQVGLDDCQRIAGLKVLFLRKVMKSAAESFDDVARRVFLRVPHKMSDGKVEFENGSRILIGGFNNENDIAKYLGIEYDIIVKEESTQLTEKKDDEIRGSLRTSRSDWRTRLYESTNPGGIGHSWFRKTYVLPYRSKTETQTRFFPSTYRDNPRTKQEYIDYLESLTGALGRAWRDGDWDSFEGMAFEQWDYDRHTCKPFAIPSYWPKWRAIDWGSYAPLSCHWYARDPDIGRVYVYKELYKTGLTDRAAARTIREMTSPEENINLTYGDPNSFFKSGNKDGEVFTPADEYAKEGVFITKADNDRTNGKRKVDDVLADLPDGFPGLVVFQNCTNLIRTLPELPRDPIHPEDVDTKAEDHCFDDLKYALTNTRRQISRDTQKPTFPLFGRNNRR